MGIVGFLLNRIGLVSRGSPQSGSLERVSVHPSDESGERRTLAWESLSVAPRGPGMVQPPCLVWVWYWGIKPNSGRSWGETPGGPVFGVHRESTFFWPCRSLRVTVAVGWFLRNSIGWPSGRDMGVNRWETKVDQRGSLRCSRRPSTDEFGEGHRWGSSSTNDRGRQRGPCPLLCLLYRDS